MPHDLAELLKRAADRPDGDLNVHELWDRGRGKRRRRIAGSVFVTVVLFAAGAAAATSLSMGPGDRTDAVQPGAGNGGEAQAATFAFHALLNTIGYDHDYQGVKKTSSNQWKVTFSTEVSGRSDEFAIVVETRNGTLAVSSVTGRLDADDRDQLLAFTESAGDIRERGYEFFNVKVDGGTLSARAFWTGAIPSSNREVCAPNFINEEADKFSLGTFFGLHAPRDEGNRDGADILIEEVDSIGDPTPAILCRPARSPAFVLVGEAYFEPVTARDLAGTKDDLDPDRHVFVASAAEYQRGEHWAVSASGHRPYSFGEAICTARVFDEQGREIGTQESRVDLAIFTPAPVGGDQKNFDVRVPVAVADPDRADSATLDCRPAMPKLVFVPE